jgi:hypothetical protein
MIQYSHSSGNTAHGAAGLDRENENAKAGKRRNRRVCVDMYGTRSGALRRGNGVVWGQLKALSKTRTLLIVRDARSLVAQLATPIFICIFLVLSQVLTNYILAASDPNPVSSPLPRVRGPSIARVCVSR